MKARICKGIDAWIDGDGNGDASFRERVEHCLSYLDGSAEGGGYPATHDGRKCAVLRVRITFDTPAGSRTVYDMEHRAGHADTVVDAVRSQLAADPGNVPGELRALFYPGGESRQITSYLGTIAPAGAGSMAGAPPADVAGARLAMEGYVGPLLDRMVSASDANTRMMDAHGRVIGAVATAAQGVAALVAQSQGGGIGAMLLRNLLGLGAQAGIPGAGAAQGLIPPRPPVQVAQVPAGDQALPPGEHSPAPTPGDVAAPRPAPVNAASAEQWARANPDAAREMAMRLVADGTVRF